MEAAYYTFWVVVVGVAAVMGIGVLRVLMELVRVQGQMVKHLEVTVRVMREVRDILVSQRSR